MTYKTLDGRAVPDAEVHTQDGTGKKIWHSGTRWEDVHWDDDKSANSHNGGRPSEESPYFVNSFSSSDRPWPKLSPDALHGLAGDIVTTLSPNTEADEAGLLLTLLVSLGAIVGPGPHALAGDEKHPARLFTVLVGKTSRGRKGTAYASVKRIFEAYDRGFMLDQTLSGLASGEGLIAALSDTEEGPRDRRVLVYEPEFARVLKVCSREGSTLSAILRDAWDRGSMRVATRKDPLQVDGAHVCVVSHITTTELRRYLTETEVAGGLGNRFLLALVKRSKKLPAGGNLSPDAVEHFALELRRAVEAAKRVGLMTRSPESEALWADIYNAVDDDVDGLFGAITARAEAQMLRLSLVYALLDGSSVVKVEHIKAAHAVWAYCEASAAYIFEHSTGDPVTDKLLEKLQEAGEDGLSHTQQNHLFGRNVPAERLDQARSFLEQRGLVATVTRQTGGRPTVVTVITK